MIFYHKTDVQLAFMLDRETTQKIANWELETPPPKLDESTLPLSDGAGNGTGIKLTPFGVGKTSLKVTKPNYTFTDICISEDSHDLVYLEATGCQGVINSPRDVILKIEGSLYQELIEWEYWTENEAFTGKYSYFFNENSGFDYKSITIFVRREPAHRLYLDDSDFYYF